MPESYINRLVAVIRSNVKTRDAEVEDAARAARDGRGTSIGPDYDGPREVEHDMYAQNTLDLKQLLGVLENDAPALEPLTLQDMVALTMFWPLLEGHKRVKWIDTPHDDMHHGTIRHLVKGWNNDGFLAPDQDVRTAFVRITTLTGGELRRPLMPFARLIAKGCLAEDD